MEAADGNMPTLKFLASTDLKHENTTAALHSMGLMRHHEHHFIDVLDRRPAAPQVFTMMCPWGCAIYQDPLVVVKQSDFSTSL